MARYVVHQDAKKQPFTSDSCGRVQVVMTGCFMEAERVELRLGRRAGSENRERQLRVGSVSTRPSDAVAQPAPCPGW